MFMYNVLEFLRSKTLLITKTRYLITQSELLHLIKEIVSHFHSRGIKVLFLFLTGFADRSGMHRCIRQRFSKFF